MKDDTISRAAALDFVSAMNFCGEISDEAYQKLTVHFENLPSATDTNVGGTDTISRRAAIKAADSIIERDTSGNNDVVKAMTAWKEYIKGLPPAQPGWIPVTERLPENDNDVLVTDGTDCAVAYWRTDAQAWDDCIHGWCDLYGLEVIAWQPLPKPWEGGQE